MPRVFALFLIAAAVAQHGVVGKTARAADDDVFSGPQVGEPLPPLPVEVMFAGDAAKPVDLAAADADSPHRLIVFVHAINRPAVGFIRALMTYAATRADDGLRSGVVFLADDQTALRQQLERARRALPTRVLIGISPDGGEGPGSYGLNRNVTLTILVAESGKVKANFALIDPSLPVELPKVLRAVCDVVGGTPPSVESLAAPAMRRDAAPARRPAAAAVNKDDAQDGSP